MGSVTTEVVRDDMVTISEDEMKEFLQWTAGTIPEPPHMVQKLMTNLSNKLSVGMGISIVNSTKRQMQLMSFLQACESELFNPDDLAMLDYSAKMELYKEARNTLNQMAESQRKFIAQNKDFSLASSDQQKLLARIMSMSPDKVQKIINILDSPEESTEIVTPEVVAE